MSGDYAIFEPSTGEPSGSVPPPTSRWAGPDRSWSPPADLVSAEPSSQPYETGDKPSTGPVPTNIIGGDLSQRDMDSGSGVDVDDGFDADDFDDCNDGDCDPHDADCVDTDCDDSGDVPSNIIRSARAPSVAPIITLGDLGRPGR